MNEERRWRDARVVEMIERMDKIESAAQILVKKKGRHNTEVAYQPLVVALEKISELLDRLEAAEKSDAESIAMYRKARDERDALHAKIEAMEKQEPVAWCATDETGTVVEALGMNQSRRFDTALYLAPGALEQARLNGMGSSREAALVAKLEALEKERDFAKTEIARLHDDIRELTDERVLDEEDRERIVAHLQGEAKAKLDSLEATEKDSAHHKALAESALRVAKGWEDKCDELRAKIEEMERQKPVAYLPLSSAHMLESSVIANGVVWNCRDKAASDIPLYTLPGADVFELHPRLDAMAKEAARYRLLRAHRPGLLLDILDEPPNPNERNALHLDREIDARLALPSEDNPSPASGRPD